jgi:hypothetical protein
MRSLAEIGAFLDEGGGAEAPPVERARALLTAGEEVLENWLVAHGQEPTDAKSEGFRLLALHRQGARGDPSFNACRETCRELVYHYNVIMSAPDSVDSQGRATMMHFVLNHLYLFISGKMEVSGLGEFCCSSRPLRSESA